MDQAFTELSPRAASLIAALHAIRGDREAAGVWVMELIAWLAFDVRRRSIEVEPPPLRRPEETLASR